MGLKLGIQKLVPESYRYQKYYILRKNSEKRPTDLKPTSNNLKFGRKRLSKHMEKISCNAHIGSSIDISHLVDYIIWKLNRQSLIRQA